MAKKTTARTKATAPEPKEAPAAVAPEDDETPEAVEAPEPEPEAEASRRLDEAIPGGRYRTEDGRLVNAHGEEITKAGKLKHPPKE